MFNADKIAALDKKISDMIARVGAADYDAAMASLDQILEERKTHTADLQGLKDKVSTLEGEKTQLTTDLTKKTEEGAQLQKKLTDEQASREETIRTQVNERAAAAGVPPVIVDPNAKDPKNSDPLTPPGKTTAVKGIAKARELLLAKQASHKAE